MERLLLWMAIGAALLFLPEWPCEYGEEYPKKDVNKEGGLPCW